MPTYGYVTKSRLLSLLIFSTTSILNDSGWERWQDAENPVSNWQADSIKALNIANFGSTGLKNYSPVKSNSSGSLSHCPQHKFQSTKAQDLNGPQTMGHLACKVQTKIKIQAEKLLEPQNIEFWPLVKICVSSYRTQVDSDASFAMITTVKPRVQSVEKGYQVLRKGLCWAIAISVFLINKAILRLRVTHSTP